MYKKWTQKEIEYLRKGYVEGISLKIISEELNRHKNSVQTKASNLGFMHANKTRKKTQSEYIKDLKEKCKDIEVLGIYIDRHTAILHKCKICNEEYMAKPKDKLRGREHCKPGWAIPSYTKGLVYLIFLPEYNLYKIGVTSKTVKQRMLDICINIDKYEIILERYFESGTSCMELESLWLSNIKDFKVNTGLLRNGNTETFRI